MSPNKLKVSLHHPESYVAHFRPNIAGVADETPRRAKSHGEAEDRAAPDAIGETLARATFDGCPVEVAIAGLHQWSFGIQTISTVWLRTETVKGGQCACRRDLEDRATAVTVAG